MKNNVIANPRIIQFGPDGSLEIIGTKEERHDHSSVVFVAKGDQATWLYHSQPDFCEKCITTWSPTVPGQCMLIFEYNIGSELRNPRKLLKSVRNKLMQAIRTEKQRRDEQEWLDHPENHPSAMFEEDRGDRSEPLPQVCYT